MADSVYVMLRHYTSWGIDNRDLPTPVVGVIGAYEALEDAEADARKWRDPTAAVQFQIVAVEVVKKRGIR